MRPDVLMHFLDVRPHPPAGIFFSPVKFESHWHVLHISSSQRYILHILHIMHILIEFI
jgi:hypothetical protein